MPGKDLASHGLTGWEDRSPEVRALLKLQPLPSAGSTPAHDTPDAGPDSLCDLREIPGGSAFSFLIYEMGPIPVPARPKGRSQFENQGPQALCEQE